jgi:hypothetical protein
MIPSNIRTTKTQEETNYISLIGSHIKQNTSKIIYTSTLINASQPVTRILINKTILLGK